MAQINALALTAHLKQRMVDFALDDHFVADPALRRICENIWSGPPEQGGLASDLWVEGAFPSRSAVETMRALVERGEFDADLGHMLDAAGHFPLDRHPYLHQLQSLRDARASYAGAQKSAIVVTAGTGSGKTESFLLPMLDDLYRRPPHPDGGVSCLILYPMNALVNDQVERLYQWMRGQERVSLFHFTSETPENRALADRRNIPRWEACRIRTRQQARGVEDRTGHLLAPDQRGPVPQILITNYSMLEYMLCRPQDAVFFGQNLRTIVLDEAHLYTGNLAAEITLLMRRVLARCGLTSNDVTQFATSATIGSGADTERELGDFASRLFGKPRNRVCVIQGEPHREAIAASPAALPNPDAATIIAHPWPESATIADAENGAAFTVCAQEEWECWRAGLPLVCPAETVRTVFAGAAERHIAPVLWNVLRAAPLISALQEILYPATRIPLAELASRIFGSDGRTEQEAMRQLLRLAASARPTPNAYPLLPNRIHFLIRAPEGLCFSFSPEHPESTRTGLGRAGYVFAPSRLTLTPPDERVALTLVRENDSGEWFFAGVRRGGALVEVPPALVLPNGALDAEVEFYSLHEVAEAEHWQFDPATGELGGAGAPGVSLWKLTESPLTGEPLAETARALGSQTRLQISLLAEAALMEMPPLADNDSRWKPARGRRLLVFSDSRAEAARLGPRLTRQHELQLFRAAVAGTVAGLGGSAEVIGLLRADLADKQARLAAGDLPPSLETFIRGQVAGIEQQIANLAVGGSLDYWQQQLANSPLTAELYDPPSGLRHRAEEWSQSKWEDNARHIREQLPELLGRELARQSRWPNISLETTGLIEVTYPGLETLIAPGAFLGQLPTDAMRTMLREVWSDFLAFVLDEVRTLGAITLGSDEADEGYQFGGAFVGKWISLDQRFRANLFPLLSVTGRSRLHQFASTVLTRLGYSGERLPDLASALLTAAFEQLRGGAGAALPWLRSDDRETENGVTVGLQLDFRRLALRKPLRLFRCQRSGQVRSRSVLGCCPGARQADVVPISEATLIEDSRIARARRDWLESPVFRLGLWAEEHSAQLDPAENLRLQNLFKAGIRNILSSTTTMELGIDIGGLNGVLMANIPPGKANYLQRAGRAGRRADGSSVVIGFARALPYEREVFLHFGEYLAEPLRRPTVFLQREKISRRHAQAWLLGEFFRLIFGAGRRTGAMNAFGSMGKYCRQPLAGYWTRGQPKPQPQLPALDWELPTGVPWLPGNAGELGFDLLFLHYLEWLREHPSEGACETLGTLWEGTGFTVDANTWSGQIEAMRTEFSRAFDHWKHDYQTLFQSWQSIGETEENRQNAANALYFQLKTFHDLTVIEALADALVLPRYGFPIGVSRLRVVVPGEGRNAERTREEDQFRLQRDSMMALREYVPGAQLLAGGRLVTSRGILKHWTGQDINDSFMLRGTFVRSDSGHFFYSTTTTPQVPDDLSQRHHWDSGRLFFPRYGFTSAAWDPPKFSNDFENIGRVRAYTNAFMDATAVVAMPDFGGVRGLTAQLRNGGEILLMNEGDHDCGFAVCLKCGYAESEHIPRGAGRMDLPSGFEFHASLFAASDRRHCWAANETPVLRNEVLAARQVTNLILFDFSPWLLRANPRDTDVVLTLAQALRLAGCRLLQLDIREVRALEPLPTGTDGIGLVLYDAIAGGSGHVEDLLKQGRIWLERGLTQLEVRVEGTRSREREAMRRLLTADSTSTTGELAYRPVETSEFLHALLEGRAPNVPPQQPPPPTAPANAPPNFDALRARAQTARARGHRA